MGKPSGGINLFESFGADVFDADKELFDGAEDHRRLGTPAVRIGMLVSALASQGSFCLEESDNISVRFEHVFANEIRQTAFLGVATVVINRREKVKSALHPKMIIVLTMARRNVDAPGAGIQRDKCGGKNRRIAIKKRVTCLQTI